MFDRIKNGCFVESLMNGVGHGIAGDISLKYPMPLFSGDEQLYQQQINEDLDEIYRKCYESVRTGKCAKSYNLPSL